jgi:glutamyl-tRNA reductase
MDLQSTFSINKVNVKTAKAVLKNFKSRFVYKNQEAISHMFRVGTGLDSQILGDFEIISQIRTSFSQSKSLGLANFMERLVNAIQASKKIKQIQK